MSAVIDVIREEAERLASLIKLYDEKVAGLPKGSLSEKVRGNKLYCYLAYREGSRVKFEYIGPAGSQQVLEIRKKIEERRKYEDLKKKAAKSLKQVEKLIHAAR